MKKFGFTAKSRTPRLNDAVVDGPRAEARVQK
jgi:hypothetical protein